ncbi:MAG: cobalamin-dependent protein [Treponema sp.]|nr:cobalamin-dependent protein [Treponema sp.]
MADIVLSAINAKWIHPSLALRLLKANLGKNAEHCEIVELALRQSLEEKLEAFTALRPKILGLSVSIWNHKATLELVKGLLEMWNAARPVIVLGGPEVSYMPKESEIVQYADYVIRRDGETAFAELCNGILKQENFPKPGSGKPAPEIIDLPNMPDLTGIKSAYHLYTDEDLRRKLIYVEASRDCQFACAFCQSAVKVSPDANGEGRGQRLCGQEWKFQNSVREFSLSGFLSDMDILLTRLFSVRSPGTGQKENNPECAAKIPAQRGTSSSGRGGGFRPTIKFLDRSFNVNIPRALSIMNFFLEKASLYSSANRRGGTAPFQVHFEMVPALFPPELKKMILRFPPDMLRLELGIQSFNPDVCAAINRPSNPEKELETIHFLRLHTNAVVHADLIAGLPGEDMVSFSEGFDRLWKAMFRPPEKSGVPSAGPPFEIQMGILKGLPGTPIRELDRKFGMVYSPEPPYQVIETAALGRADLERLVNFARFWELIVNRPWKDPPAAGPMLSRGKPVFWEFMELSETLFSFFGRNWGIDRNELRAALERKGNP